MRIIAGKYKGRTVKFPDSKFVRPTTDRVKESLFNILENMLDFEGINVLDVYAGSGSLGLESVSRGASGADFVEKNFPVIRVLKQNIENLGESHNCNTYKMDAVKFSRLTDHRVYDLILADPPFFKDDIHQVASNVIKRGYLKEGGLFLVERSVQTLEKDTEEFGKEPFKKIGDSVIYSL